jgi:hypothetical protein
MQILPGGATFIEYQKALVSEIVRPVAKELRTLTCTEDEYKETLIRIVFNVCCVLDGTSGFEVNGKDVSPIMTFSDNSMPKGNVISCGGNSYTHEYVVGAVKSFLEAATSKS